MSSAAAARRRITGVDLARYAEPVIPGNRSVAWRIAWHIVSALAFQSSLVLPSRWKAAVLRCFGARIGSGLVIKPRVTIKYPWFLELGDHVWLGEGVWIDNHTTVAIGSHVCISQGAYLFTGNHDWNDPRFRFFCHPITIADGGVGGRQGDRLPRQRARAHERRRRRRGMARHDRTGWGVYEPAARGTAHAAIGVRDGVARWGPPDISCAAHERSCSNVPRPARTVAAWPRNA